MNSETPLYYEQVLWQSGVQAIAGVDEAGRGPLAGPVVAAAVIFPVACVVEGVDDSKKLSSTRREELFSAIRERATAIGVGIVDHQEIDRINILQATFRAMYSAVDNLAVRPDHLLVDGNSFPARDIPFTTIIHGDALCHAIAAASIIAKVTRDRIMLEQDVLYPEYGFARHKGYGTSEHRAAIERWGLCPIHRRSFCTHFSAETAEAQRR
jgi:ribonuclease HII